MYILIVYQCEYVLIGIMTILVLFQVVIYTTSAIAYGDEWHDIEDRRQCQYELYSSNTEQYTVRFRFITYI